MSKEIKPVCLTCFKKNDTFITFCDNILLKCNNILVIRKGNDLSMSNAKLTKENCFCLQEDRGTSDQEVLNASIYDQGDDYASINLSP